MAQLVKNPSVNAGDSGPIPGLEDPLEEEMAGRSLGGGHGNPLQYFCLENPMDRGAWLAIKRVAEELDVT